MVISNKQIMQLMSICRRYANVCDQMGWMDDKTECKALYREIEAQQSDKLEDVNDGRD